MFKNIQIADDFSEVKHGYIPENILRKTIEGYYNSFDFITFKKSNQSSFCILISEKLTLCNLAKSKMKFKDNW